MTRLPNRSRRWIFAFGAVVGSVAGGAIYAGLRPAQASPSPTTSPATVVAPRGETISAAAEDAVTGVSDALASLADRITPAVVQIEVREAAGASAASAPQLQVPDEFRRFFQLPESPRGGTPMPRFGAGSGFLVSPDGFIVTNNHVVADAEEITVRLNDRTSHEGRVVGRDPTTDVAVVKIEGHDLPFLQWGSSDRVRVGEMVMAIGNPGVGGGQLEYTVTTGIISAKGRPLPIIEQSLREDPQYGGDAGYAIENFLQTDAVINPGNSGGPMVDVRGNVIGVNSAIATTDGYYQGYGFAIPADLAHKVADDLMQYGRIKRPWLGVSVSTVTAEDADVYGLSSVMGVVVQSAVEDGPAERAGIRPEDVIVALDDEPIERPGDLQQLVAEHEPGQTARLELYRDGRRRDVDVRLGESPVDESVEPAAPSSGPAERASSARLGMDVADLTPALASRYGLDRRAGVVVTDVTPWMSAGRKGIQEGVVILELNHKEVRDAADFQRRLGELKPGTAVSLKVLDASGVERFVSLRLAD